MYVVWSESWITRLVMGHWVDQSCYLYCSFILVCTYYIYNTCANNICACMHAHDKYVTPKHTCRPTDAEVMCMVHDSKVHNCIWLIGFIVVQPVNRYVQVSSDSIFNLFEKMKWDQQSIAWEQEADLRKVLQYARGSKLLRVPEGWKEIIPKEIWKPVHGYDTPKTLLCFGCEIKKHRLETIHGAACFGLACTAQSCGFLGSLRWNRGTSSLPSSASMFVVIGFL